MSSCMFSAPPRKPTNVLDVVITSILHIVMRNKIQIKSYISKPSLFYDKFIQSGHVRHGYDRAQRKVVHGAPPPPPPKNLVTLLYETTISLFCPSESACIFSYFHRHGYISSFLWGHLQYWHSTCAWAISVTFVKLSDWYFRSRITITLHTSALNTWILYNSELLFWFDNSEC